MKKYYLVVVLLFLFPITVFAQSKTYNMAIEPKWGWYFPNDRNWWKEGSAQRRYSFFGGLEGKYAFLGSTEISLGLSFIRETWERENQQDPNENLFNSIDMFPADLSINYRLQSHSKQLFVPYFGIGLDYIYGKERQENTVRFHRYGYHFTVGGQLLLNFFINEENSNFGLDEKFGINAAYLFFEGRYADLDNFDADLDGHDISGYFYSMGIVLEF